MSHLTASPFHKPSPFEFPHRSEGHPHQYPQPSAQLPTPASIVGPDLHATEYFETPAASVSPEASGRFRRVASSIVYHNSGLRESRERTVHRSSRTFVVVLPPPSLPQDHGHLGHTLSSGPRHRLSQGLLMPLFPTMYGQLQAIAREYNFPSTTGLCLYLHFTDHGITVTPRISDDSWQMIWNHAFDPAPSTSAPPSLPISGKIEFDIDLRLARWYGSWMASSHREHVDVPMSVTPSAAPSIIHYREESRTTFADGDDQDSPPLVARPAPRHVPRKLSLIDRFDVMSSRSVPRSVVARAPPPPPAELPGSQNLSPIFQADEPKTAKYDLEHRVKSWRASASVLPGTIAEAGHILIAGSNLPSSPLDQSPMPTASNENENADDDEYRIEDYSFSISSAGPGDYDPYSPLTWYYDPSVHLAHRAQGSVCMTPSDCTSFGPSDYTLPEYVPSLDLNGVRTPDIAHRMFEDVPPSPSVATSWGAPLSYPASPMSEYRAPSVDLGDRQCFSRPMTPMTATSWGAPESLPPSPTTPFYVRTPDAGQRAFDFSALTEHDTPWSLVWPYHNSAKPWAQVWPYHTAAKPWTQVWPYHTAAKPWAQVWPYHTAAKPWTQVWPYHLAPNGTQDMSVAPRDIQHHSALGVYPHFDLYPAVSGAFIDTARPATTGTITIRLAPVYPAFNLYPAIYPGNLDEIYPANTVDDTPAISTRLSPRYPIFDLYPAVYPHVVPYPYTQPEMEPSAPISTSSHYPHSNLYSPIGTSMAETPSLPSRGPISVVLSTAYPVFNLYPALYPVFDIYPALDNGVDFLDHDPVLIRLIAAYPIFNLYPAVYPVFDLYPALPEDSWGPGTVFAGYTDFDIHPAASRSHQAPRVESANLINPRVLAAGYPDFDIYPAVSRQAPGIKSAGSTGPRVLSAGYPDFDIYPATSRSRRSVAPISVRLPASYPILDLYPPVYPVLEIYPEIPEDCALGARDSGVPIRLAACYPIFNLYPSLYPVFEIYPALPEDCAPGSRRRLGVSVRLAVVYPIFDLYPAVYPSFEIYPSLPEDRLVSQPHAPSGYPHFNLYPAVNGRAVVAEETRFEMVCHSVNYPNFNLYPAVYPNFDLYPEVWKSAEISRVNAGAEARYPAFNMYPAVYPFFDLYPCAWEEPDTSVVCIRSEVDIRVPARYPYFNLYPAIYPHFDFWPSLSSIQAPRVPKQSRFTRSDLHALVKNAPLQSQHIVRAPPTTHQALHLAVFPKGSDVLTPSGTVKRNVRKTHLVLHRNVFPSEVKTPSGTEPALKVQSAPSRVGVLDAESLPNRAGALKVEIAPNVTAPLKEAPSVPPRTRARSGSVLRMSLPPSPRPVGGRSPTVRAPPTIPPTIPLPAAPTAAPRRTLSTSTRHSVFERVAPSAPIGGVSLNRSVSMASPPSSVQKPSPLDRTASVNGSRTNLRRESLVSQRVRAFQMQTEQPIREDDPISSFPLPPRSSQPPTRKVVT